MLDLSNQKNKKKNPKRIGRGSGSGTGKTGGRGNKGQKSRSGGTKGAFFEGGQTPLYRRLPKKRGFKNILFKKEFKVINLKNLNDVTGEVKFEETVKILGVGELKKPLTIYAAAFSKSAKSKIEKAGGEAVVC
ncbi:50S ribosomal protein L15 [Candidatus Margulisiibacteriota bacterium]